MTRDLKLWNILMGAGMILGLLSAMPDTTLTTQYGLPQVALPYLRLTAFILTAMGKLGNSPLPHSDEIKK